MSDAPALPAGRDLDALVAKQVLGWIGPVLWIDDDEGRDPYMFEPDTDPALVGNPDHDCIVPWYSTDINDALDVVSALMKRGITLPPPPPGSPNVPLYICYAALAAVEDRT